jgi:hypothetical protein
MTDETVKKLEEAFAIGAADAEACFYAGITKQTLYNYQEKYPAFLDRKEALKQRPVLLARQTVVKAIENDSDLAFKYLERKANKEFAAATKTLLGNDPDNPITDVKHMNKEELEDAIRGVIGGATASGRALRDGAESPQGS